MTLSRRGCGLNRRLRLGISMGDPAGVGPELIAKVLRVARELRSKPDSDSRSWWNADLYVFGDARLLDEAGELIQSPCDFISVLDADASSATVVEDSPGDRVIDFSRVAPGPFAKRRVSAEAGRASYHYFQSSIHWALRGLIDAIVTCPINKESLNRAGLEYPGHTEILEAETQAPEVGMMLTAPNITCSLVTTHVPLAEVPRLLSSEKIERMIRLTHEVMSVLRNKPQPRLTVLGLNPHAGEHGLFGSEEATVIEPAIRAAQGAGFNVRGPLPPDTAFLPKIRSETDAYICMYHDQGLIPLKALAFDQGVNVTLGLPIVRTSVDHGTAFDIAWQGVADESSLISALELAAKLAVHRREKMAGS